MSPNFTRNISRLSVFVVSVACPPDFMHFIYQNFDLTLLARLI